MNMLFSDKTGTITQGNLSLVEFITWESGEDCETPEKQKNSCDAITIE